MVNDTTTETKGKRTRKSFINKTLGNKSLKVLAEAKQERLVKEAHADLLRKRTATTNERKLFAQRKKASDIDAYDRNCELHTSYFITELMFILNITELNVGSLGDNSIQLLYVMSRLFANYDSVINRNTLGKIEVMNKKTNKPIKNKTTYFNNLDQYDRERYAIVADILTAKIPYDIMRAYAAENNTYANNFEQMILGVTIEMGKNTSLKGSKRDQKKFEHMFKIRRSGDVYVCQPKERPSSAIIVKRVKDILQPYTEDIKEIWENTILVKIHKKKNKVGIEDLLLLSEDPNTYDIFIIDNIQEAILEKPSRNYSYDVDKNRVYNPLYSFGFNPHFTLFMLCMELWCEYLEVDSIEAVYKIWLSMKDF